MAYRRLLGSCCVASALLAGACGGGTEPGDDSPHVGSVQIVAPVSSLVVGASVQLTVTVRDDGGHAMTSPTISWSTSDASVLAVTPGGIVSGIRLGSATVIAASGGHSDSLRLDVSPIPVSHVIVTPAQDTVGTGLTIQLLALTTSAENEPLAGRAVAWTSGDPAIATVSATGLVQGVHEGVVTVSATSEGVSGSAQITVAPPVATVTITPSVDTLYPGQQLQLVAEARDVHGDLVTGVAVQWASNPYWIAGVTEGGMIDAIQVGSATITASVGDVVGTMSLAIVRVPVDSISITPQAISLVVGGTFAFNVHLYDSVGHELIQPVPTFSTTPDGIANAVGYQVIGVSLGSTTYTASADGVAASAQVKVVQVSYASAIAGTVQTCGLSTDGLAFCWGQGSQGLFPSGVIGDREFDVVRTGGQFSCGLASGVVSCWGGQPATGETYLEPTPVPGAPGFTDLVVGDQSACGLAGDGTAHCWGSNSSGELGDGTTTPSNTATTVTGGHTFVALAAGRYHACGLTGTGEVYCWGGETVSTTPRLVSGGVAFASISGGFCGLDASGEAYCWDDTQVTPTPTAVSGFTFTSLSGRTDKVCGLQADGSAWCWATGTNSPSAVPGGLQFVSLTAGSTHACGIATNGRLYCWGSALAIGSGDGYTSKAEPTLVAGQP